MSLPDEKTRILIVEDDSPIAQVMEILLADAGCDVAVAHTGKKGMELATRERFDLIALDIDLPDTNGFDLCCELKQRHFTRKTPVVFISGQASERNVQRGFQLGAVDFIPKPFEMFEFAPRLLAHVKQAIAA